MLALSYIFFVMLCHQPQYLPACLSLLIIIIKHDNHLQTKYKAKVVRWAVAIKKQQYLRKVNCVMRRLRCIYSVNACSAAHRQAQQAWGRQALPILDQEHCLRAYDE